MKKEILENVLQSFNEAGKAYSRMLREYSTVKDKPGTSEKAHKYVKDIRDVVFNDIINHLTREKAAIIDQAKVRPSSRDMLGELRRNNELQLIKSSIDGASNEQLIDLARKYSNTEYEAEFKTMIQPSIKALSEFAGPERAKNLEVVDQIAAALDSIPDEIKADAEYIDNLADDVRSLLYFNEKSFPVNIIASDDGRILHGNCDDRIVKFDIENADVNFDPVGGAPDPLVVTETMGIKSFRTVRYQFEWE